MKKTLNFILNVTLKFLVYYTLLGVMTWAGIFVLPIQALILFIGAIVITMIDKYTEK